MTTAKKRSPVKARYARSIKGIKQAILSRELPTDREIDISMPYRRSTFTLKGYVTLDWDLKSNIRKLIKGITKYAEDNTRKRPFNILMMAEPGSGKSYFIKCLASEMDKENVSAVTFNMAILRNIEDLIQPLESVRNLKVVDRLPLLFLDEFDSAESNFSFLLPLLWDGDLHLGNADLKLGKLVVVLAGSNPAIQSVMDESKSMHKKPPTGPPKLADLLSRINGGVFEIPGFDIITKNRDSRVEKICLAISLLQNRFGQDLELVPWSLLRFVASGRFRYGVRSIAHLIELIPGNPRISIKLLPKDINLPLDSKKNLANSSLAYHLIAADEGDESAYRDSDDIEEMEDAEEDETGDENVDSIVELWSEIRSCRTLVRIQPEKEEEDY